MSIIRFRSRFEVPESFDMFAAFQQFTPLLSSMNMLPADADSSNAELALSMFSQAPTDIPVLFQDQNMVIASTLKSKYIVGNNYQELETFIDEEATILCKVQSLCNKPEVEIFDPLRDFVRINRTMRRGIERNEQLAVLHELGPVLKVETIAIYN